VNTGRGDCRLKTAKRRGVYKKKGTLKKGLLDCQAVESFLGIHAKGKRVSGEEDEERRRWGCPETLIKK